MNIYYFNINYSCNNRCRFCFSHNTFLNNERNIGINSINNVIDKCRITANDRIIINGGEPTLHPAFKEILETMFQTGAEIVLYSNGRLLKDYDFCLYILQRINRIVIPVHGNQFAHDEITQCNGAFSDTEQAITQIADSPYKDKLELKFIVSGPMIKSGFCVLEFLKEHGVLNNRVVISGLVKTKIAKTNPDIIPAENEAGEFIANTVNQILPFVSGIKLMDFQLCKLPESFSAFFGALTDNADEIEFTYYFIDGNFPDGKMLEYNRQKSDSVCQECAMKKYCTSVLDSCLVLEFNETGKNIVLE